MYSLFHSSLCVVSYCISSVYCSYFKVNNNKRCRMKEILCNSITFKRLHLAATTCLSMYPFIKFMLSSSSFSYFTSSFFSSTNSQQRYIHHYFYIFIFFLSFCISPLTRLSLLLSSQVVVAVDKVLLLSIV